MDSFILQFSFTRIALTKSFIQYTREINGALEVNKDIPISYLGKPENEASFLCKPCGVIFNPIHAVFFCEWYNIIFNKFF